MARHILASRKQRTRQHVIADQSVNHVERFILDEGHTAQRMTSDYGYDLLMMTHDKMGFAEAGYVLFQLKASDNLTPSGEFYSFDLGVRDYNLWIGEQMPVILILFDARARKAYWLHIQRYFDEDPSRRPAKGTKTIRVRVSRSQRVNRIGIKRMRTSKEDILIRLARRT